MATRWISEETVSKERTDIPNTKEEHVDLCEALKRLGFSREMEVVLYGYKLELISDPIVIGPNLVFVDAIESKSGLLKRVRIPLIILNRARANLKAT